MRTKLLSGSSQSTRGFTIIELIVVFSILAVISTIGIASFSSYTNSQKLRNAVLDVKTLLQQARSQSLSQALPPASVITPQNCGVFQGYAVRICPAGAGCTACLSGQSYELDAMCSAVPAGVLMTSKTLPSGVTFDSTGTTQRCYQFIPVSGGIVKGGNVKLNGSNGQSQTVTVSSVGVIQ